MYLPLHRKSGRFAPPNPPGAEASKGKELSDAFPACFFIPKIL